jgi:hypothetical protein
MDHLPAVYSRNDWARSRTGSMLICPLFLRFPARAGNPGRAVGRGAADFPFLQIGWRRRRGLRYGVSFADIGSQHYGHDNPSTIVRSDVSRLTLAFMLHEAIKA